MPPALIGVQLYKRIQVGTWTNLVVLYNLVTPSSCKTLGTLGFLGSRDSRDSRDPRIPGIPPQGGQLPSQCPEGQAQGAGRANFGSEGVVRCSWVSGMGNGQWWAPSMQWKG